jgi:hypothetical protein
LPLLAGALFLLAASGVSAEHGRWVRSPRAEACIGGEICGYHGDSFSLPLASGPVSGVRFFAHDDVGRRSRGKLRVSVDGYELADYLDIRRDGEVYELEVRGIEGRYLTFEALGDDEVVIEDIQVLYGGRSRPARRYPESRGHDLTWRPVQHGEACFGGEICGHYGYSFEVPLSGAPVYGLRFHAHDDVGDRTRARLRVTLDGYELADYLDVKKVGGVYELEVDGLAGRTLVFEVVGDDEAVVSDVEVLAPAPRPYRPYRPHRSRP